MTRPDIAAIKARLERFRDHKTAGPPAYPAMPTDLAALLEYVGELERDQSRDRQARYGR